MKSSKDTLQSLQGPEALGISVQGLHPAGISFRLEIGLAPSIFTTRATNQIRSWPGAKSFQAVMVVTLLLIVIVLSQSFLNDLGSNEA